MRNFEATTATKNNIAFGYAYVVEFDMHVAVGRVIFTKDVHRANNFDTLCVHWHKYLRLPVMLGRIRVVVIVVAVVVLVMAVVVVVTVIDVIVIVI